jgi:hypothetical protein
METSGVEKRHSGLRRWPDRGRPVFPLCSDSLGIFASEDPQVQISRQQAVETMVSKISFGWRS